MDDLGRRLEEELAREHAEKRADVHAVLGRGRRLRLYRTGGIAASVVALLLVSDLGFAAVNRVEPQQAASTDETNQDSEVLMSPEPVETGPYEPDPDSEVTFLPEGPRYAVAKGTFDDSWGSDSGKQWRLMVWGDHVTNCWRFEIGEMSNPNEGRSCTMSGTGPYAERGEIEHFQGWSYFPAVAGHERAIAFGAVSAEVDHLSFSFGDAGGVIREKTVDAPSRTTIRERFFVSFLPPEDCGAMTAIDKDGNLLARKPIVRGGCK